MPLRTGVQACPRCFQERGCYTGHTHTLRHRRGNWRRAGTIVAASTTGPMRVPGLCERKVSAFHRIQAHRNDISGRHLTKHSRAFTASTSRVPYRTWQSTKRSKKRNKNEQKNKTGSSLPSIRPVLRWRTCNHPVTGKSSSIRFLGRRPDG